ncbi:MAG: sulfate adenylyltransferase subunit CysN [Planctomycetes bacterium]|nr:sulfate adenylyltransferase subunit CysN [Planctomycetota bacterium]
MDAITLLEQDKKKDLLRFVTAGSVDDGKSTLIGRLLYDSKGIYEDQLDAVKTASDRWGTVGGDIDLALVTDGLKAEREQGITIDVAYRYFTTPKRKFIIADSPGHEQYTRNMATGASTANLSIILIDAENGVLTQSKRHTFITSLLGIPHIVVAVNKMDLVDYSEDVYSKICEDYTEFAAKLEVADVTFIPVSALKGDNVVETSKNMPWYRGSTLLNHLESVHIASDRNLIDLRFPVQYVLRPDRTFRGYLGTVASGTIKPGEEVMVIPSGVKTKVKTVFSPDGELDEAFPPLAVGITTEDEVDISRGDMLVHVHNVPKVDRTIDAMVVWMSDEPLSLDKDYYIKQTTKAVSGRVSKLHYRVDVNTLHRSKETELNLNEIGRCVFTLSQPIAYDPYNRNRATGSFIIVDRITNNTVGAGMILDRVPADVSDVSISDSEPKSKHVTSQKSLITIEERIERMGAKPKTIWLTGLAGSGKTTIAYNLERKLFDAGQNSYVIDGENARLGFSKDLGFSAQERGENIRRAAEFARMLNEAGVITICSFLSPYESQRQLAREIIGTENYIEVYLSAPLDQCRKRAKPGIYDMASSGEIKNFTGVTAPYEQPENPDIVLPTHEFSVEMSVAKIIAFLETI